ncbi:hypothetical protein D9Q98_004892 [Chlorella vulgaris]|uniref:NECAP PHear domain-containing protein n=1 Tax=Chlorella vulgaris TaxID=3077 RepID=A0A9D4TNE9_CHLVU|nr:hypothetical protein D9Q98_004892 [Chlorella vulgaris]
MEQVLFVHRELDVYRIPPRVGAGGWRSGEWRMSDKIFTGRVRVVAVGEALEVRLEDPQSCELFGVAPMPPGQAQLVVEQASDSSRNFVLRLEDAASKRHAFVGVSFADRATAFDFNVAISDHQRQQRRTAEMQQISSSADPVAAAASILPEAAALYRSTGDLSLKEGQTIKITVKKKEQAVATDGDSFLSRMGQSAGSGSGAAPGKLVALAPPPAQLAAPAPVPGLLAPPPPAQPAAAAAAAPADDLLGWGPPSSGHQPAAAASVQAPAAPASDWATFD